ncbi:hypothetical protein [Caulobacter sp. 602-1]|uniref:hypothetical protein n=1 Tax=Caulobacter sp. 602-1 TaxID=2492472 RepID=UPI000F63DD3A|nr:hypothetical protein [Caulobacter sp. 602-1]RRN62782.1 hypothetical protein EIK80_19690 [Caulobacter sp. 602-1]
MPAQITALPTPPSTNDPANFNTRADAFLGQMPTFVTEANALATEVSTNAAQVAADRIQTNADRVAAVTSATSALSAPGTNGTSSTSLTVGTGAKTFTTQTGKAWVAGQGFFIASSTSPTNWMSGILTAYNSGTGAATVQVDTIGGSGTLTAWNCGLSAGRPMAVATQAQAEAGTDATTMMTPERTAQAAVAFGVPVGCVLQAAGPLGARWLPCTGLVYQKSSYPALGAIIPSYVRPLVRRLGLYSGNYIYVANGVFFANVNNGVYTSPDGAAWTARTTTGAVTYNVQYGGGIFIGFTDNNIYTSDNGYNWTLRNVFSSGTITYLAYGGGQWLAFAYNSQDNEYYLSKSSNGTSWSAYSTVSGPAVDRAIFDSRFSRWLAYGSTNRYSTNAGSSWANFSITLNSGEYIYDIILGGGKFIARTSQNRLLASNDGMTNFSDVSNFPLTGSINKIYHDGTNLFVACGNKVATSSDLNAWVAYDLPADVGTVVYFARLSGAITSPTIISGGGNGAGGGIWSGLDTSLGEFKVPQVTSADVGLNAFIKAA